MKFKSIAFILFFCTIVYAQNNEVANLKKGKIEYIISVFKQKDIDEISKSIEYPLIREYPIPQIKNRKEFIQRFSDIFDDNLVDKIANSKIEQWSEVGWRGIMLDDGIVWIEPETGKITAINYQSGYEKKQRVDLIEKDRLNLYFSLRIFENPTYKIKTKRFLIRIDELSNEKYRYASWKVDKKESSKPDIILENGELDFQGSGGNHVIVFTNKNYTYKIYCNILGTEETPDITLEVLKNGQVILSESGALLKE